MMRLTPALAAAALLAVPAAADARSRYCSPTGDYCTSVAKVEGKRLLRLATFSFRGKVRVCVTPPSGARECESFRLRRDGDLFEIRPRWSAHFQTGERGRHRVTFAYEGTRLGPALDFSR